MNEQRLKQLEQTLQRILSVLEEHYQPEQVIVFGSFAAGHITETSDLDLLIVKQRDQPVFTIYSVTSECRALARLAGPINSRTVTISSSTVSEVNEASLSNGHTHACTPGTRIETPSS